MDNGEEKKTFEENIENFMKIGEKINAQFKPLVDAYSDSYEKIKKVVEPIQRTMEKVQEYSQEFWKRMQQTLEVLKKVGENDENAKRVRGEIVTSIIILDDLMEGIILKLFVKEEKQDDFSEIIFPDEKFSSGFKMKILDKSGLLNEKNLLRGERKLKSKIQTLLEIRNKVAHSKYLLSEESVEIFNDDKIEDIFDLEQTFRKIFREVTKKLEDISRTLDKKI